LGSDSQALDGILGFGQSNSSVLSQLAAASKVPKIFAHCLDTVRGGGIFAIGDVVQPIVKTTPLVPNMYVALLSSKLQILFIMYFHFHEIVDSLNFLGIAFLQNLVNT